MTETTTTPTGKKSWRAVTKCTLLSPKNNRNFFGGENTYGNNQGYGQGQNFQNSNMNMGYNQNSQSQQNQNFSGSVNAEPYKLIPPAIPLNTNYQYLDFNRQEMQLYLQNAVDGVVASANFQVSEKHFLFQFLNVPPVDLETYDGLPIFYKDPGMRLQEVLSYGIDIKVNYF